MRDKTTTKAGKVLVVNSDTEMMQIIEVNLAHANLEVILTQNLAEVLQIFHNDKSDIIILDQDLLDVESAETSRTLKELSVNVPVILIGSRPEQRNSAGPDENAVSYITKPFDPGEVVAMVQRHLLPKDGTHVRLSARPRVNKAIAGVRFNEAIATVFEPERFRGRPQNIDSLQLAMDINRKEAREALKNIQRIVASLVKTYPPALKDSINRLAGDVQDMAVLGNQSLYLAADFKNQLEMQQDRLSEQDSDRLATLEAILAICRNLARSIQVKHLFSLESSKRVAKYALAIAGELKVSDTDRQELYRASLIKDLALAFSRAEVIERSASISRDAATALKERLNHFWKALVAVPFLSPACNLLLYVHERYDGTGGSFGLKGEGIPVGSRILAVADAYDMLTSNRSPRNETVPELAVQEVNKESGLSFDPHVVSALLMLLKRNEIDLAPDVNKRETRRGIASG